MARAHGSKSTERIVVSTLSGCCGSMGTLGPCGGIAVMPGSTNVTRAKAAIPPGNRSRRLVALDAEIGDRDRLGGGLRGLLGFDHRAVRRVS